MSFRSVFLGVVIAFALVIGAFLVNRARPKIETEQPSAEYIRASGKCAECHLRLQYSVVHQYELSLHARKDVNCLDCHQPVAGQEKNDHHGFLISTKLTAGNCRSCHEGVYQQFLRSRHAAPAWAAVYGEKGLTPDQVNLVRYFSESLPLHVADEEESILPRLLGRNASLDETLNTMRSEHDQHKPELESLIRLCRTLQYAPQQLPELREGLRATAGKLEREFLVHLEQEEKTVFPAIRTLLNVEDREAMLRELRARR